jgi:hypothetical protein
VLNHEPPNNSKAEQSFSNMLLNVRDKHKQVQANIAAGFSEMLRAGVPKWCVSFSVCLRLRVCLRVWACVCVRACVRVRACVSPCVIACARAWLAGERGADGTGGAERGGNWRGEEDVLWLYGKAARHGDRARARACFVVHMLVVLCSIAFLKTGTRALRQGAGIPGDPGQTDSLLHRVQQSLVHTRAHSPCLYWI